jgi:Arc/MetJ family transcription regulator
MWATMTVTVAKAVAEKRRARIAHKDPGDGGRRRASTAHTAAGLLNSNGCEYIDSPDVHMDNVEKNGYTVIVRKTTLLIDDALVEEARTILGTHGIKDTVDRALGEVIGMNARRALIRRLQTQNGLDLADDEMMRSAWGE